MKERVASKPTKKKCYRWITPKFGSVDNLELKECEIDPPVCFTNPFANIH